jgi:hypothetical protein
MPGVFPDYPAPVIRNADTEREMVLMRWECRRLQSSVTGRATKEKPRKFAGLAFCPIIADRVSALLSIPEPALMTACRPE